MCAPWQAVEPAATGPPAIEGRGTVQDLRATPCTGSPATRMNMNGLRPKTTALPSCLQPCHSGTGLLPPLVVPTASPINSVALARLLHHHPNRPWVVWLCVGSRRGFDGGETCPQIRLPPCRNSKSATDTPAAVAAVGAYFVKEVIAGRFAAFGPLCPPMRIEFCPIVRFCPVGTTPKRSYTGKPSIRVTSNHSKEQGGLPSYNEGIDAGHRMHKRQWIRAADTLP